MPLGLRAWTEHTSFLSTCRSGLSHVIMPSCKGGGHHTAELCLGFFH